MKHTKRLVCLVLAVLMLCSILPATALAATPNCPFYDVEDNSWYTEGVEFTYLHGLMNGTSGTTFAPKSPLTRGMLVTILYRVEGEPKVTAGSPFTDVASGQYYTNAVIWAAQNEIVNGVGHGKFAPNSNVTREQLAAIFYRYSDYKNYDVSQSASLSDFSDAAAISGWARPAVAWAVAEGLVNGISGAMKPGDNTTRAQVATILYRYFQNIVPAGRLNSTYTKAMQAYTATLTQYTKSSSTRFTLVFINDDCIPELVTAPGGSHMAQPTVYTYYNGKVMDLGDYGEYGTLPYNPWGNCFGFYTKPYKIVNGTAVPTTGTITHEVSYGKMYSITIQNIETYLGAYLLNP